MKVFPESRSSCGCFFASFSIASITTVLMCAILHFAPAESRMGVFMAIPGLVIFLGACGTVLGSTAGLSSQRNAAVFGTVFMGLPFFSLLVLALFHACKLRAGHLAAEALSASAMGATLSVLSVRFVNWIEALRQRWTHPIDGAYNSRWLRSCCFSRSARLYSRFWSWHVKASDKWRRKVIAQEAWKGCPGPPTLDNR